MSYAVSRAAQPCASSPPATATVFHYDCLYTHDLRRKQKRWQDGKVKFHSFNKRYMVYDERGGFIGDGHWQGDASDFAESLELELDRGAAIVQVDRCTGSEDQDLTEILDKRAQEVEKRRAIAAAKTSVPGACSTRPDQTPMQHRPLNELMPSRGPIGRAAIPNQSPFEMRKKLFQSEQETKRAPTLASTKERREHDAPPSKMGHAQSLFGTKLTLRTGTLPNSSWKGKVLHFDRDSQQERPKCKTQEEEEKGKDHINVDSALLLSARKKIARSHAINAKGLVMSSEAEGLTMERALFPNFRSPTILQEVDKQALALQEQRDQEDEEHENSEMASRDHGDDKTLNTVLLESSPEPRRKSRAKTKRPALAAMSRETQRKEEKRGRQNIVESGVSAVTPLDSESSDDGHRSSPTKLKKAPCRNDTPAPENVDTKRQSKSPPLSKEKKTKKRIAQKENQHAEKQDRSTESNVLDVTALESSEKRTQLRSKSRPKRGLLILSELSEKEVPQAESSHQPHREVSRTTRGRKSKIVSYHEEIMGISSDESEDCSMPSKATASKVTKRKKEKNEDSDDDSGPRITKMARKSVKSKEIIGFAVPVNDLIPASFISMVNPVATTSRQCAEVETSEAQKPKIANPATRGKKAARREDAAGQVPRSIVPFEPVLPDLIAVQPCTSRTHVEANCEPKRDLNRNPNLSASSNKDTLNTGAWSKHAMDLLGMTRPLGKAGLR